jgi:hypothetical protein
LRIALPRLKQRFAFGNRELQHAHLQRHDLAGPVRFVRPQHRQRRERAVVQALALEERQVELVRDQRVGDVSSQFRVALQRWQLARTAAFVGDRKFFAHAQREVRVVVEEERRDVVVVDEEQHIRLVLFQPFLHRLVALEDRRPDRVVLLVGVVGEADGRVCARWRCRL